MKLKDDTFGPLKNISKEDYAQIWQSTGIDIDGRQDYLSNVQLPNLDAAINRFVAIVKSYPGFQKLPIEDQISLVKGRDLNDISDCKILDTFPDMITVLISKHIL